MFSAREEFRSERSDISAISQ